MRTSLRLILAMALLLVQTGCFWSRKAAPPPTPPAARAEQRKPPATAGPAKSRRAPKAKTKQVRKPNPPEQPKPVPRPPAPTATGPEEPPRLAEIVTDEERAVLALSVISRLASARRDLAFLEGATLTANQSETVRAIRSFITRAEKARQSDLPLAAQLAYRAEVLANSLAAMVR